jgi:serine protease AprX
MNYAREILLLMLFKNLLDSPYNIKAIDPGLMQKIRTSKDETVSAIVFHKGFSCDHTERCVCRLPEVKVKYRLPIINAIAVEMPASYVTKLATMDEVSYLSEDTKVFIHMDIARQTIKKTDVLSSIYSGKDIGVAVIDTGVAPHPDLIKPSNRIVAFKDFVNNRKDPYDDNGHGTHVAGCIAGNGYSSFGEYAGIAPEANIIALKALDQDGSGDTSNVLAAIQWAVDNKKKYNIRVLNLSLGTQANTSGYTPLDNAVMAAWNSGLTVVSAAGNEGPKKYTISSPGICPDIITVGALDDRGTPAIKDDTIADFSSRGPTRRYTMKPDIVAPGVDIVSLAVPSGNSNELYKSLSGTSMATPVVSGCIALIHQMSPSLSNKQIKKLLMSKAVDLGYPEYAQGAGLIDLSRILPLSKGGEHN